jgi:hypothetical protein
MTLEEIQIEWDKDCSINIDDLGEESIRISKLHAKYITLFSNYKLHLRKAESEMYAMRNKKVKWFSGYLSKEELDALGWDQYLGNKPLKQEMQEELNSDPDMRKLMDRLEYFKTINTTLEFILKSLHGRTWDIKNAIEMKKLNEGW